MQHEINKSVALICRGHSFFSTNAELLDRYAACPTSAEVIQVQTDYLDQLARVPARIPNGKCCTLQDQHCMSTLHCALLSSLTARQQSFYKSRNQLPLSCVLLVELWLMLSLHRV